MVTSFATNDPLPERMLLSDDGEEISSSIYKFSIEFCT